MCGIAGKWKYLDTDDSSSSGGSGLGLDTSGVGLFWWTSLVSTFSLYDLEDFVLLYTLGVLPRPICIVRVHVRAAKLVAFMMEVLRPESVFSAAAEHVTATVPAVGEFGTNPTSSKPPEV